MKDCHSCTEECPQAELAHQAALGRMYALNELIPLLKKIESGELAPVEQPRWIPVTERLPETFKRVLVARPGEDETIVEQGYKDVGPWWKVYGTRTKYVTHWMPLPEPPTPEESSAVGEEG